MTGKAKRNELTETFIDAWGREECLWDVTSHHYKNREKKQKSINIIMEKFDMTVQQKFKPYFVNLHFKGAVPPAQYSKLEEFCGDNT